MGGFGVGSGRWWRDRVPAVVALVVVAGLIAGTVWLVLWLNRDDHKPASGPVPGVSTSPTATERPPTLPDAAKQQNLDGVKATIQFEISALNYAQRTTDFGPVKSVYNMGVCKSCSLLVDTLSETLKPGYRYVDAEYTIRSIDNFLAVGPKEVYVEVAEAQEKEGFLLDAHGKKVGRHPADPGFISTYWLKFQGSHWVIQDIFPKGNNEN